MLTANRKTEDCAFLALLIGVTALFLWMMLPFFDVIFWAATIGILFHPVYRTIAEKWRMGRILSAFITILLCLVLIIIPLSYILYNCIVQAVSFAAHALPYSFLRKHALILLVLILPSFDLNGE